MKKTTRKHNLAEWLTFILGLVLIAAIIAFLIVEVSHDESLPPQLKISSTYQAAIKPYAFEVIVENTSKQTAEGTQISFALYQDGKQVETALANFDYIAAMSQKTAWIIFYKSRKEGDSLGVASISYVKP